MAPIFSHFDFSRKTNYLKPFFTENEKKKSIPKKQRFLKKIQINLTAFWNQFEALCVVMERNMYIHTTHIYTERLLEKWSGLIGSTTTYILSIFQFLNLLTRHEPQRKN